MSSRWVREVLDTFGKAKKCLANGGVAGNARCGPYGYCNNPMANSGAITLSYLYPYSLLKKANRDRRGSGAYQAD